MPIQDEKLRQAEDVDGHRLVVLVEGEKPWRVMRERDVALVLRNWPDPDRTLSVYPLGQAIVMVEGGPDGISSQAAEEAQRAVIDAGDLHHAAHGDDGG